MANKFPEIIFRVIGSGQLESKLNSKIKNLKLKNNFFIEKKQEAYKYLKAFDMFVLPSVKEGLPYTILEAMQAALPIIATKVGGIPELIEDEKNGLLINSADPDLLAKKIIEFIENKNLATDFGNQAKVDVENNFGLEKMISETEKIYQQ